MSHFLLQFSQNSDFVREFQLFFYDFFRKHTLEIIYVRKL